MPWALRGLSKGILTTRYPRRPDPYAENGIQSLATPRTDAEWDPDIDGLCPTDAIIGPRPDARGPGQMHRSADSASAHTRTSSPGSRAATPQRCHARCSSYPT